MANNRFVIGCKICKVATAFDKYYNCDWGNIAANRYEKFCENHNNCGGSFDGNYLFVDCELDSKYEWQYESIK